MGANGECPQKMGFSFGIIRKFRVKGLPLPKFLYKVKSCSMKRSLLLAIPFLTLLWACDDPVGIDSAEPITPETESDPIAALGPFMGMEATDEPQMLAPHLIATSIREYNGTFSPDGTEFFYTTNAPGLGVIFYSSMDSAGRWSQPVVAPFSGTYSEYDPLFSPDGEHLYFSSERPWADTVTQQKANTWRIDRTEDGGWTNPEYVKLTERGDYFSSTTTDGTIYFNVWNDGFLYKATPTDEGYDIEALPPVLNSGGSAGDPFIAADESYLIYRGYDNSLGRGDLYISFNVEGEWSEPQNLGEPINSMFHEMCPYVTTDGRFFVWASARVTKKFSANPGDDVQGLLEQNNSYDNGQMNVYYMSADFIDEMRAAQLEGE